MIDTPKIGDSCKAESEYPGKFMYGVITKIENDLAYSDLDAGFCGDTPTTKEDGVWVFTSF